MQYVLLLLDIFLSTQICFSLVYNHVFIYIVQFYAMIRLKPFSILTMSTYFDERSRLRKNILYVFIHVDFINCYFILFYILFTSDVKHGYFPGISHHSRNGVFALVSLVHRLLRQRVVPFYQSDTLCTQQQLSSVLLSLSLCGVQLPTRGLLHIHTRLCTQTLAELTVNKD